MDVSSSFIKMNENAGCFLLGGIRSDLVESARLKKTSVLFPPK